MVVVKFGSDMKVRVDAKESEKRFSTETIGFPKLHIVSDHLSKAIDTFYYAQPAIMNVLSAANSSALLQAPHLPMTHLQASPPPETPSTDP